MTAGTVIEAIVAGGGRFVADGVRIRVTGPDTLLTAEIVALLKLHRDEIRQRLRAVPRSKRQLIDGMTLTAFAGANIAIAIDSDVLGERVYFASNGHVLPEDERGLYDGHVIYHADELRLLTDATADELRLIHECKKVFGGSVVSE